MAIIVIEDFCLSLLLLLVMIIIIIIPNLQINAWYLDDGTLCGSNEEMLVVIKEDCPPCGLHLNRSKYLLFVSENEFVLQTHSFRYSFYLGCTRSPVVSPHFCWLDIVRKFESTFFLLPSKFILLCNFFVAP